jgi:hypothetical protein
MRNKIKDRVYLLLEMYPETRNCDATLTAKYWMKHERKLLRLGEIVTVPLIHLPYMTPQDAISRVRRKIQNEENRFWPTDPNVAKRRNINMESWKEWARVKQDCL